MSHINQDNLYIEKENWKQQADLYFKKVINQDINKSDTDNRARKSVKTENI